MLPSSKAEPPVILPVEFVFAINLRTARTLGLVVPPGVLAIADEAIEARPSNRSRDFRTWPRAADAGHALSGDIGGGAEGRVPREGC
jgi:hypothetical protein